jgi:hypothetical protein
MSGSKQCCQTCYESELDEDFKPKQFRNISLFEESAITSLVGRSFGSQQHNSQSHGENSLIKPVFNAPERISRKSANSLSPTVALELQEQRHRSHSEGEQSSRRLKFDIQENFSHETEGEIQLVKLLLSRSIDILGKASEICDQKGRIDGLLSGYFVVARQVDDMITKLRVWALESNLDEAEVLARKNEECVKLTVQILTHFRNRVEDLKQVCQSSNSNERLEGNDPMEDFTVDLLEDRGIFNE